MKIAFLVPDNRDEFRRYEDPAPFFGPAPTALLQGFEMREDCEVHVVCCTQRALVAPEKIARNIFFHCMLVPKWGWLRGGYLGCIRAVRQKLAEIRPDIVHGQGTERYCALAAIFSGRPNVVTVHGNMRAVARINHAPRLSFQGLSAALESFALPRTAGVFCNSAYTESQVKPIARQTWRVPNALRKAFFVPATTTAAPDYRQILNIGFIEPRKNQVELLEMAGRLFKRGAKFHLKFVGKTDPSSPYAQRFLQMIPPARAAGYADYLGEKSESELIQLMDEASGFIHAPKEEAFGLVVGEALARNLRLFGFREGGVADIAEGVAGSHLVESGDWAGLEKALFAWLQRGGARAEGGFTEMQRRYHPLVIAQQHVRIYSDIIRD